MPACAGLGSPSGGSNQSDCSLASVAKPCLKLVSHVLLSDPALSINRSASYKRVVKSRTVHHPLDG